MIIDTDEENAPLDDLLEPQEARTQRKVLLSKISSQFTFQIMTQSDIYSV